MFRASSALRYRLAISSLAGLFGFSSLSADPLPEPPLAPHTVVSDSALPRYKSPGNAFGLSLLGASVPVLAVVGLTKGSNSASMGILFFGGLLVGPSVGQFYAGSPGSAVIGMGLRAAGVLITIAGFKNAFKTCDDVERTCRENDGQIMIPLGMLTMLGGTVYSLVDAPLSANRFNAEERTKTGYGWSPTLSPGADGIWKAGATAWMRF